jgi:hypothetical protein
MNCPKRWELPGQILSCQTTYQNLFFMATSTLIAAAALVVVIFLIIKIAKTVIRLILIVVGIGLAVYFWRGGNWNSLQNAGIESLLGDTTLEGLKTRICGGAGSNDVKCACIAMPLYQDIASRLSPEEIAAIDKSRSKVQEELKKSLANRKKEITDCLLAKKGPEYMEQIKTITEMAAEATIGVIEKKVSE